MGQDSFERISLDTYEAKLGEEYQKNPKNPYPADQTYVFTGSRNFPGLPSSPYSLDNLLREKPIPDQDTSDHYQHWGKAAMSKDATRVPSHRMARSLRQELRNPTIHDDASAERFFNTIATDFVKNVKTFHLKSIDKFIGFFPYLSQEFQAHMKKRNVSIPMTERFERLLSGDYAPSGIDQSAFFGHSIDNVANNNIFRIISKTHGKEAWKANGLGGMALAWEDRSRGQRMVEWMGGRNWFKAPAAKRSLMPAVGPAQR